MAGPGPNLSRHMSMTIKMYTMDMIQYTVDKANMVTTMAKSHFRGRVLSPLVLLNHEIP
jgi:hypothetical protein